MSSFEYINYNAKTGKWYISYEAGSTGEYFVPIESAQLMCDIANEFGIDLQEVYNE